MRLGQYYIFADSAKLPGGIERTRALHWMEHRIDEVLTNMTPHNSRVNQPSVVQPATTKVAANGPGTLSVDGEKFEVGLYI